MTFISEQEAGMWAGGRVPLPGPIAWTRKKGTGLYCRLLARQKNPGGRKINLSPLLSGILLLTSVVGSAQALTPAGEYDVKAAFLVNFGGFVRWPDSALKDAQSPFTVCIIGEDPFGFAFEPFKKKKVAGRPLDVQSVASPATAQKNCQILFIAGSENSGFSGILKELRAAPVLTVSDIENFALDGGMIQLFTRDQKIRFEINRSAAEAAGLKIDARLLKLAEPARGTTGEQRR
jgi:hypothetical protein